MKKAIVVFLVISSFLIPVFVFAGSGPERDTVIVSNSGIIFKFFNDFKKKINFGWSIEKRGVPNSVNVRVKNLSQSIGWRSGFKFFFFDSDSSYVLFGKERKINYPTNTLYHFYEYRDYSSWVDFEFGVSPEFRGNKIDSLVIHFYLSTPGFYKLILAEIKFDYGDWSESISFNNDEWVLVRPPDGVAEADTVQIVWRWKKHDKLTPLYRVKIWDGKDFRDSTLVQSGPGVDPNTWFILPPGDYTLKVEAWWSFPKGGFGYVWKSENHQWNIRVRRGKTKKHLFFLKNYPNPFSHQTTIQYRLPVAQQVKLTIYNVMGQQVITLINQPQAAGSYKVVWDGRNQQGQPVPSGVYFYRLEAGDFGDFKAQKRMLLLK